MATRERILDLAHAMIQEQGYNAVSFRDLAAAVKIKTASIHYYFPSKEDLVVTLVDRYRELFSKGRQSLESDTASPKRRLQRFIEVVRMAFRQTGRMCLCGILAAETSTVPEPVADSVRAFFIENEQWLATVLADGRAKGDFHFAGSPEKSGQAFFASLEGALMSAWTFKDEERVAQVGDLLIRSLGAKA